MPPFRTLTKSPGFTVLAVLMLALGLGANTAIFSAVYSILLKPLPFEQSERLVAVRTMVKRDTWEQRSSSRADFRDYRAQATRSFESMANYDDASYNLTGDGEAARVRGEMVSHDFFTTLGVQPALGRTFTAAEDSTGGLAPLVVLSDDFWRNRFAASPAIVGRTIKLSEVDYTVIGVMRPGFRGLNDVQFWIPTSTLSVAQFNARGNRGSEVVGRLRPGVTLEQARAELAAVGGQLALAYPGTNANYSADVVPLRDEFFGSLRRPLLVLLGAVGLVLVVTCANVANLMLVRLAHRRREVAIRVSLGASRGALARLFLGEAALLSALGGGLGVLLATWLVAALKLFAPIELPAFVSLELHWPAFAFALGVSLGCALVIGALPALLAARTDLNAALKDAGRTGHSGAGGQRIRAGLVTAEIALSLALLVASALFVRSFINLVTQAPGFSTENVLTLRAMLPERRYASDKVQQFTRTLLERAATLPGVQSVAVGSDSPLEGISVAQIATIEGGSRVPAENEARVYTHFVTGDFFRATGMTLLQGETFAASYAPNSAPVALVSENFARRFWPNGDAVGQRLKPGRTDANAPWFRIIGVVAETKYRGLVANPTRDPDIYGAYAQIPQGSFTLVVRTATRPELAERVDGAALAPALRQLVTALDPNVPVAGVTTIEERVSRSSASQRFSAQLMGAFACVALLLAAIGLYGVVSFGVSQRTQEIGVRMALGARPADILRMVIGGTGRLVLVGLVAGTALAFALTRFIESLLFNVDARDPLTYAAVAFTLAVVALFAAWLPARRAAKVDPMTALRAE